jgi:hypothetical protein
MPNLIFSNASFIELQGKNVLELISYGDSFAEYRIIGFDSPPITIIDYRSSGIMALEKFLDSGDIETFPYAFSIISLVEVFEYDNGEITIRLHDYDNRIPVTYMLWIAIGIEKHLPVYDYIFYKLNPLPGGKYAFASIYERSLMEDAAYDFLRVFSPR